MKAIKKELLSRQNKGERLRGGPGAIFLATSIVAIVPAVIFHFVQCTQPRSCWCATWTEFICKKESLSLHSNTAKILLLQ
jgi:hypothetical protein